MCLCVCVCRVNSCVGVCKPDLVCCDVHMPTLSSDPQVQCNFRHFTFLLWTSVSSTVK